MRRFASSVTSVGELPGGDDVAVAELDDVAVGVDVGDDRACLGL